MYIDAIEDLEGRRPPVDTVESLLDPAIYIAQRQNILAHFANSTACRVNIGVQTLSGESSDSSDNSDDSDTSLPVDSEVSSEDGSIEYDSVAGYGVSTRLP